MQVSVWWIGLQDRIQDTEDLEDAEARNWAAEKGFRPCRHSQYSDSLVSCSYDFCSSYMLLTHNLSLVQLVSSLELCYILLHTRNPYVWNVWQRYDTARIITTYNSNVRHSCYLYNNTLCENKHIGKYFLVL